VNQAKIKTNRHHYTKVFPYAPGGVAWHGDVGKEERNDVD
jgi:hypothetical protein